MKKIFACICFALWTSLCGTSFAAHTGVSEINVMKLASQTSEEPYLLDVESEVDSCLEAYNISNRDTAVSSASAFQISQVIYGVVEVHILPYPYPLSDSNESNPEEEYESISI